jgi:hypothetical protein
MHLAVAHFVEQLLQPVGEGPFGAERLAESLADATRHGAAGPRIQLDIVRGDVARHEQFRQHLDHSQTFKFKRDEWFRTAFDVVVDFVNLQ